MGPQDSVWGDRVLLSSITYCSVSGSWECSLQPAPTQQASFWNDTSSLCKCFSGLLSSLLPLVCSQTSSLVLHLLTVNCTTALSLGDPAGSPPGGRSVHMAVTWQKFCKQNFLCQHSPLASVLPSMTFWASLYRIFSLPLLKPLPPLQMNYSSFYKSLSYSNLNSKITSVMSTFSGEMNKHLLTPDRALITDQRNHST